MTRINCVPPSWLLDEHLRAELRELTRVYAPARALRASEDFPVYLLGEGHVRFFYERIAYLIERQGQLRAECLRRGFSAGYEPPSLEIFPPWLRGQWEPDAAALQVNLERLAERHAAQKRPYHLHGELAEAGHYERLLETVARRAA